jgi:hypothetical protein
MTLATLDRADLEALDELLGAAEFYARSELAKAVGSTDLSARNELLAAAQADMAAELGAYFEGLAERLGASIAKAQPIDWDPAHAINWTVEQDELFTVLVRWWTTMGEGAFAAVSELLGVELRWDVASEGVAALIEAIGERVTGINETSRRLLAAEVARAVGAGRSVDELARSIRDLVGSWASTPEGGAGARSWMIAATETAIAYNSAAVEGFEQTGLVEEVEVFDGPNCGWTSHDDPDHADGSRRTLKEAADWPVSHPHCVLPGTIVEPLGYVTAAFKAAWSGPIVEVRTAAGARLSVGPNHPVLTGRGWIPAELLCVGDDVIRRASQGATASLANGRDPDDGPARVEEVFDALGQVARDPSVVAAAANFHGDGRFVEGEVDVVRADRLLAREAHASRGQESRKPVLPVADPEDSFLASLGSDELGSERLRTAALRCPGGLHVASVGVLPTDGHAALPEPISESAVADASLVSDALGRFACEVALDQVIEVRNVESWSGHVYDLETTSHAYFANGLIVHNCQRAFGPVVAQ